MPQISVILPVYNAAPYVEKAINSILQQSFLDFELLLLDDGSTDNSSYIVREYAKKDERIRLIQRENRGLIATLNEGILLARAPYIARMDADDVSLPYRLEIQFRYMEREPKLVALGSAIQYINEFGKPYRRKKYPAGENVSKALLWGAPLAHPSVMLRTLAVRDVGGYPSEFTHAEDYALWLRLQSRGRIDNVPNVLLYYRIHKYSVSHINALQQRNSTLRAQAIWLSGNSPSPDLLRNASSSDFLKAIGLPPHEEQALLARMLALSPHLIGTGPKNDPEGTQWLKKLSKCPKTKEMCFALALYHLRAARKLHIRVYDLLYHIFKYIIFCGAVLHKKYF